MSSCALWISAYKLITTQYTSGPCRASQCFITQGRLSLSPCYSKPLFLASSDMIISGSVFTKLRHDGCEHSILTGWEPNQFCHIIRCVTTKKWKHLNTCCPNKGQTLHACLQKEELLVSWQLEVHPTSITTQDYTNSSWVGFWLYGQPLYAGNEDIVY